MHAFAFAILLVLSTEFPPEMVTTYRDALEHYNSGRYEEARRLFQKLALSEDAGPLAHFALGNVFFQQSTSATGPDRTRLLRASIRQFRQALDASAAPLKEEDVRFNLELAKERLQSSPDGEQSTESPTSVQGEKMDVTGETTVVPDDENLPKDADLSRARSKRDQGVVKKPLPGLEFQDPGPVSPARAEQILTQVMQRLAGERTSASKPLRPKKRLSPDDY